MDMNQPNKRKMFQVFKYSDKPNWITGELDQIHIGKPLKTWSRANNKATKLDLDYGATRYHVKRISK